VLTTKDGQLLSQREVLKSQLRTQPEGDRNQTQQSQNRRGHGFEVSRPMTRNVNTINMAGVLANHRLLRVIDMNLTSYVLHAIVQR
jgi:hypothetical protein